MKNTIDKEKLGLPVPIAKINKNLTKLWQDMAESKNPIVRASVLNLIVISHKLDELDNITAVVKNISNHHPGRVIIIAVDILSDSKDIRAFISTHCRPHGNSEKYLCSEIITILTGKPGQNHITGIILPLLLSDLPVFLWWMDTNLDRFKEYQNLTHNINRILLNSPDCISQQKCNTYLSRITSLSQKVATSDLQWAKLTDWREAIASFFDQDNQNLLDNINELHISHSCKSVSLKAILLLGWMASILDWQLAGGDLFKNGNIQFVSHEHRNISVTVLPEQDKPLKNEILKIQIKTGTRDKQYTLDATRTSNGISTIVKENNQIIASNLHVIKNHEQTRLVCNELDFLKEDKVYLNSIRYSRYAGEKD